MNLSELSFQGQSIRHVQKDDTLWFHIGDLCASLDIKNPPDVAKRVREITDGAGIGIHDARNSRGETRPTNYVKEQYMYMYIIPRSRKPSARAFVEWMGKVIVNIRKTGKYSIDEDKDFKLKWAQMEIQKKDQLMRLIAFARDTWSDDARLESLMRDSVANMMSEKKTEGPKMKKVSEIMEDFLKPSLVRRWRSKCGKHIKQLYLQEYDEEPPQTETLCNNHNIHVFVYPVERLDLVTDWVKEYIRKNCV